jgi:hypothetical protein
MTSISRRMTIGLLLASMVLSGHVLAQQPSLKQMIEKPDKEKPAATQSAPEQPQPEVTQPDSKPVQVMLPADEFNRGSPRTSVEGFLAATGKRDFTTGHIFFLNGDIELHRYREPLV